MHEAIELTISIHSIMRRTFSEGPGERCAIWVQGCSIRCPGCCNPEMISFQGGIRYSVGEIYEIVRMSGVEGLSVLGGEPFDQARACALLCRKVKECGMGVMVFSGYSMRQINAKEKFRSFLPYVDLLKTGPYIRRLRSRRYRWTGSSNQKLHFLTDRYRGCRDITDNYTQSITVDLSPGSGEASGWPDFFEKEEFV